MTSSFKNLDDIEGSLLSMRLLHVACSVPSFHFMAILKNGVGPSWVKAQLSGRWALSAAQCDGVSSQTPVWAIVPLPGPEWRMTATSHWRKQGVQRRDPGPLFQLNTILTRLSLALKVPNLPRQAGGPKMCNSPPRLVALTRLGKRYPN